MLGVARTIPVLPRRPVTCTQNQPGQHETRQSGGPRTPALSLLSEHPERCSPSTGQHFTNHLIPPSVSEGLMRKQQCPRQLCLLPPCMFPRVMWRSQTQTQGSCRLALCSQVVNLKRTLRSLGCLRELQPARDHG